MPFKISSIKFFIGIAVISLFGISFAAGEPEGAAQPYNPPSLTSAEGMDNRYNLPPLAPPELYGDILIDRTSTKNRVRPVVFSHWLHRREYTCRVCHSELEFSMKTNTTEITEADNQSGRYCGACHNGRRAFRHNGNCHKCHNGNIRYSAEKFAEFDTQPYPRNISGYGNGINWVEAQRVGMISPATYIRRKLQSKTTFDRTFFFPTAGALSLPPALFSHTSHVLWLDCSNCHPDLFTAKKNSTKDISMDEIVKGKFCGACHISVAFPLNDCGGCHPGMKERAPQK